MVMVNVYLNTSLSSSIFKLDDININSFEHYKIIILAISIPKQCIVSIYRSFNANAPQFLTELTDFLYLVISAVDRACQIYFASDFNINLLHCYSKLYVNEFVQLFNSQCFDLTIFHLT